MNREETLKSLNKVEKTIHNMRVAIHAGDTDDVRVASTDLWCDALEASYWVQEEHHED